MLTSLQRALVPTAFCGGSPAHQRATAGVSTFVGLLSPADAHATSRDTALECLRASSGIPRLVSSGDPGAFDSVTLQDRLVRFDTKAGALGYGDPIALVVGAQPTDVLGQHDRSAHLRCRGVVER